MHQQQSIVQPDLQYQNPGQVLREEDKIPLFLLKLWNIVEDQSYYDIIRWDDSGYSFHIIDPYSFCRNVLPQYFKHNNLNSLIRQLNMYGFRKMTPIERTSLARAESDQDHLEFSHPYFVRDYPHLLSNIKRKSSSTKQLQENSIVNLPSKDLTMVFEELKQLRERQKNMEYKMNSLVKENETIWHEMDQMRTAHLKQQQIVNKLVHFLVSLVHPNKLQRLEKRQLLAINEFQAKRTRNCSDEIQKFNDNNNYENMPDSIVQSSIQSSLPSTTSKNANEMIDSLLNELAGGAFSLPSIISSRSGDSSINKGPIIADVTDELEQLQCANNNESSLVDENYIEEQNNFRLQKNFLNKSNRTYLHPQAKKKNLGLGNVKYLRSPIGQTTGKTIIRHGCNTTNNSGYNLKNKVQQRLVINENNNLTPPTLSTQQIVLQPCVQQNKALPRLAANKTVYTDLPLALQIEQPVVSQSITSQEQNLPQLVYEPLKTSQMMSPQIICETTNTPGTSSVIANESSFMQPQSNTPNQNEPTIITTEIENPSNVLMNTEDPLLLSTTNISNNKAIDKSSNSDPIVTFEDSPTSFNSYLNSVNQSINQCRDDIADHWNTVNLDNLLDAQEWQELLYEELAKDDNQENDNLLELDELMNIPLETPQKHC